MKKILFILAALMIMMSGCMKDYNDPSPAISNTQAPFLKVTGAIINGDTAYAAPNVYLKFWVDSLPLTMENYTFSWNLGDGDISAVTSPEKKYNVGVYTVSVAITPIHGGAVINRSIVLKISNVSTWETTLILMSASPVAGGNYDYAIAMRTTAIYNYDNIAANPWDRGDFTGWEFRYLTETTTINGILYIVDHVILPANTQEKQLFTYGKGSVYAYAPESRYWVVTNPGEGVFQVYLTNGQMSYQPIGTGLIPGDNGDVIGGSYAPTIRTELKYSSLPLFDSLRIFINYAEYANGPQPFIARLLSNNNWQTEPLVIMTGDYAGWGYQIFAIKDLGNGLYWRFGPSITAPSVYGQMSQSKFYMSGDNMLGLQISSGLKTGDYQISLIE